MAYWSHDECKPIAHEKKCLMIVVKLWWVTLINLHQGIAFMGTIGKCDYPEYYLPAQVFYV